MQKSRKPLIERIDERPNERKEGEQRRREVKRERVLSDILVFWCKDLFVSFLKSNLFLRFGSFGRRKGCILSVVWMFMIHGPGKFEKFVHSENNIYHDSVINKILVG